VKYATNGKQTHAVFVASECGLEDFKELLTEYLENGCLFQFQFSLLFVVVYIREDS
jgi:hypothetical protein